MGVHWMDSVMSLDVPVATLPERMKYYEPIDCVSKWGLFGRNGIAQAAPLLVLLESGRFQVCIPPETVPNETVIAWVLKRRMFLRPATEKDFKPAHSGYYHPAVDSMGGDVWVESVDPDGIYSVRVKSALSRPVRLKMGLDQLFINQFEYRKREHAPHWKGPQ